MIGMDPAIFDELERTIKSQGPRAAVERLCQRAKIDYSDEKLQGALPRLARASIEDVMSAVGRGEMKASDVARAMYPDYKDERVAPVAPKSESGWSLMALIFTLILVAIGLTGSLWVMYHLNANMMPSLHDMREMP